MARTVDRGEATWGDTANLYEVLGCGRDDQGLRRMQEIVSTSMPYVEKHYDFPTYLGRVVCCEHGHWHRTMRGAADCRSAQ